jgi:UrcA family protein
MDLEVSGISRRRRQSVTALLGSVLVTAALGLGVPATLPAGEPRQEWVRISDLHLDTQQGQHQLRRRLNEAAARVCEPAGSYIEPTARVRLLVAACKRKALAGAQQQLAQHGLQELQVASRL